MDQSLSGFISYVGTLVQCAATLLTVLLFWVLERYAARRAYFTAWTRAWLVLMVALLALVARYTIVTNFDTSDLDRDPTATVWLLYFTYQFGKLLFACMLIAGALLFTGSQRAYRFLSIAIPAAAALAAVTVYAADNLNEIVAWQAAALTPAFAYCAYRLLKLGPGQRTLGTRLVGSVCVLLTLIWALYLTAFTNVRVIVGLGVVENPWSLFTINNSFIDSLLAMLLSMGMVVMLMESATRETEEARAARLRDVALSEARLSSVIRSASDAIVTVDSEGKINLFNPAAEEIFGVSVSSAMGAPLQQFIIPEQREALGALLRQEVTLATPVPITKRKPFTGLRRGEEFPLELSVSEFFLSGSRSQTLILRDLSNLRRAETERDALHVRLAHAQRMEAVGQLVSGVAHELNNPLAAVLNFSEILLHDPRVEHDRLALTTIREQARRCRTVVRNLLTFVREGPIRLQPVMLHEVLDRVSRSFEPEFAQFGIQLRVQMPQGLPLLEADPEGIEQALTNLVSNAVHAIGTFGEIIVSATDAGENVVIVVEDTGPGISPEVMPRVFEPFFTAKRTGKGTGLGLSVCQGIVELHGGSIRAENREAPAQGARFVVTMPVHFRGNRAVRDKIARRPGKAAVNGAGSPSGGRVLLVEDETALRSALRRYFERNAWRVDEAETGWEGLNRLLNAGTDVVYDLVVCDLKMPGMTGIELHDHLLGARPELLRRFIFVTGDVASSEAAHFISNTRQPVLEKPFELAALAAVIADLKADVAHS